MRLENAAQNIFELSYRFVGKMRYLIFWEQKTPGQFKCLEHFLCFRIWLARHGKAWQGSYLNKKWTPPPPLKEGPRSSLVTWWALRLRWCRACWMQPPRCGWAPWATSPERSVPSDWCLPTISYQILTLNYPLSPSLSPRTCQIKVGKRKLELQFIIFIIIFS